jgi:hypothetical protein
MDEPSSALDVLTSETLRNEVIDIYTSKTSPVNSILIIELTQLLLVVKTAELLDFLKYLESGILADGMRHQQRIREPRSENRITVRGRAARSS